MSTAISATTAVETILDESDSTRAWVRFRNAESGHVSTSPRAYSREEAEREHSRQADRLLSKARTRAALEAEAAQRWATGPRWDMTQFARWDFAEIPPADAPFHEHGWHRVIDGEAKVPDHAVRIRRDGAGR
jgi:hypothetical protein